MSEGNGAEPFLSFIVLWTIGAHDEPVTIVAAWYAGSEARRAHAYLLHAQGACLARLPGCGRWNAPAQNPVRIFLAGARRRARTCSLTGDPARAAQGS